MFLDIFIDDRKKVATCIKCFTNKFALLLDNGDPDVLTKKFSCINLGKIMTGTNYYLFENPHQRRKSTRKLRSLQFTHISRESNVC